MKTIKLFFKVRWLVVTCLMLLTISPQVWGTDITWNFANAGSKIDLNGVSTHDVTADDGTSVITFHVGQSSDERAASGTYIKINGKSGISYYLFNSRWFSLKAPSAAGKFEFSFDTKASTMYVMTGTSKNILLASVVGTANSTSQTSVITNLTAGITDLYIAVSAATYIKYIKWIPSDATTDAAIYTSLVQTSMSSGATLSSSSANQQNGGSGVYADFSKYYKTGSSGGYVNISFTEGSDEALTLNSNGSNRGRIRIYYGAKSFALSVNGSATGITYTPTTTPVTFVNIAEYTIPNGTTELSSIRMTDNSGSSGGWWCKVEVLTHDASGPSVPTFGSAAGTSLVKNSGTVSLTSAGNTIYYKWSTNSSAYAANAGSTLASAADGSGSSPQSATAPDGTGTYYLYAVAYDGASYSDVVKCNYTITNPSHSVSAVTSTGDNTKGTVSAAASSVAEGGTTTITASPAAGYKVTNWDVSGTGSSISPSGASNSNTTTLTMGSENATVTATFGPKSYTVTLNNQSATSAGTENVTTTYNSNTNLTSAITCPTKTSKVFAGYFTATNGGGVQLIDPAGNWIASAGGGSTYLDGSKNWKYDNSLDLYACWMEYASTFDIQTWVQNNIDDTKTSTNYTILETNKLIYSLGGSSALDNSNKSSYEGLKMKNSGDYVMFLVQANYALKLYFGYTGTDPKKSINGGAEANMGVSSTGTETANQEVDFGTQTYDRLVKVRTVNANSVVLQKIEITAPASGYDINIGAVTTNPSGEGGSISADKATAAEDETVTLTATPNSGFQFGSWTVVGHTSGDPISVSNNKFTMPDEDVDVTASFNAVYSISYKEKDNTTISATPTSYVYGTGVASLPTPTKSNYTFSSWYLEYCVMEEDEEEGCGLPGCGWVPACKRIEITSADYGDVTYLAEWKLDAPTISCTNNVITMSAATGATIYYTSTTDGSTPADPTSESTAYNPSSKPEITQDTKFKAIAIEDGCINSNITSQSCTYEAGFTASTSVNIEQAILDNGTSWAYTTALSAANISYDLSSGCSLDNLNYDCSKTDMNNDYRGLKIKSADKYIQINLAATKTLKVRFGKRSTAVKVWIDEVAQTDIPTSNTYYTYDLAADNSNNRVVKIATADGNAVVIKQIMIGEDIATVAIPSPISIADGITGGTISATSPANAGSTVTVTVTPSDGYVLSSLTYEACSGGPQDINQTTKQFTMPTSKVTLNATFCRPITAVASTGSVTSIGTTSAVLPYSLTNTTNVGSVTIKVYEGETLRQTYVDVSASGSSYEATGLTTGATYTYTVTPIGADGYCDGNESSKSSSFRMHYSVTLDADGGTINSGDVTSYTYGVGATLPVAGDMTAPSGAVFLGWYDGATKVISISTTATGNKSYKAKWGYTLYDSYFYQTYATTNTSRDDLVANAGFPAYISTSLSGNRNQGSSTTSSVTTPHDFSALGTTSCYFVHGTGNVALEAVADVKTIRIYGFSRDNSKKMSITAKKVSGSGSDLSISDVNLSTGTIVEFSVNIAGASGYNAATYYDYTLSFGSNFCLWGIYVEKYTNVPVTGVSLNKSSTTLTAGDTEQLTATIAPANATNKAVSWTSSNTSAATVSSTGLITAKAEGETTITVTTSDGSYTATCDVTVEAFSCEKYAGKIFELEVIATSNQSYSTSKTDEPEFNSSHVTVTDGHAYAAATSDSKTSRQHITASSSIGYIYLQTNSSVNWSAKLNLTKCALRNGDVISFTQKEGDLNQISITTSGTRSTDNTSTSGSYTVTPGDGLAGASTIYLWHASSRVALKTLTITRPTSYVLTYNTNGGRDDGPADERMAAGTNKLSTTVPSRAGYVFEEWNSQEDGEGTGYEPGALYTMPASASELFAKWVEPNYSDEYAYVILTSNTTANTKNATALIGGLKTNSEPPYQLDGNSDYFGITLATNFVAGDKVQFKLKKGSKDGGNIYKGTTSSDDLLTSFSGLSSGDNIFEIDITAAMISGGLTKTLAFVRTSSDYNHSVYWIKVKRKHCVNFVALKSGVTTWSTEASDWIGPNGVATAVPDEDDVVYLDRAVTVGTGVTAHAKDVILGTSGTLTISSQGTMIAEHTIRKSGDVATGKSDLIIDCDKDHQGALIFENPSGDKQAQGTVNFYTKSSRVGGKLQWQYVGYPFESGYDYDYDGYYINKYSESQGKWIVMRDQGDRTINAWEGLAISGDDEGGAQLQGTFAPTTNTNVSLTHGNAAGENLVGNSWTAPIQLADMDASDFGAATATVYIFNTGRFKNDGSEGSSTESGTTDHTVGQWLTIPISSAKNGVWAGMKVIPAFQAFEVITTSATTLSLDYSKVVRSATNNMNAELHAPARRGIKAAEVDGYRIRVADSLTQTDMYLFEDMSFTTDFDNGWEGYYMPCDGRSAQLYAQTALGKMAVAALPDLEGTLLGFKPGKSSEYTFSFGTNAGVYYLNDIKTQTSTLMQEGYEYTFTWEDGDDTNRFMISATPFAKTTPTGIEDGSLQKVDGVQKVIYKDHMYIIRGGRVFDATGGLVK